jgi:multisubunit Na+/H+ antiporter MnhC subunit
MTDDVTFHSYVPTKLLNINIAFQYFGNTDAETTSLVCSSILLIIMLGWFFIENTYWLDPYVRYTVTQYPGLSIYLWSQSARSLIFSLFAVIIFGTFGILSKQADPNRTDGPVPESVRILTWIILGVASIQLAVRLVIVIYRYRTRPLFESEPVATAGQNE